MLASVLALAAASCGGEPSSLPVHIQGVSPGTTVGIVTGASWILDTKGVAVGPSDMARLVDPMVGAVTAFVDANGDGIFDSGREASVWCERTSDRWTCELSRESLMLRRQAVHEGEERFQNTQVFVRRFDAAWSLSTGHSLCDGRGPVCAAPDAAEAAQPRWDDLMLPTCQHDWNEPFQAVVTDAEQRITYEASQPAALATSLSLAPGPGGHIRATLSAEGQADRHILWVGEVDQERQVTAMHWTTESAGGLPSPSGELRIDIPAAAFDNCTDNCVVGYQVAHRAKHDTVELHSQSLSLGRLSSPESPTHDS